MEWIAALDFEKIANAIIILLVGFLGAFGFRSGKRAPPAQAVAGLPHMEIAGALVDATSVKALAGSIEGHSLALVETRAQGRDIIAAIDRHSDAVEKLTEAVGDHLNEIREHRHEMSRRR